jgi:hypothetical protein
MKRFGLVVVALLAVLGGVLGWAVVAGPVAVPLSTTSTITPVLSSADAPAPGCEPRGTEILANDFDPTHTPRLSIVTRHYLSNMIVVATPVG